MKKTRHPNRLKTFALMGVILTGCILLAGCGQAPQEAKAPTDEVASPSPVVTVSPVKTPEKPPAPEVAPQPAPPAPVTAAVAKEVAPATAPAPATAITPVHPTGAQAAPQPSPGATEPAEDKYATQEALIKFYKDIQFIQSGNDPSATAEKKASFEKIWENLLAKNGAPQEMCDEAELVASAFKRPAKEGEPSYLYMLFQINKPFKKERGLKIAGFVDQSHLKNLRESERDKGYGDWSYLPEPPTTKWKDKALTINKEAYILIRRGVTAADIPYNIKIGFFANDKGKAKYDTYGKLAELGWRVAD